jgi:O-antigen/teichoic acid export membrane protein
MVAMPMTRSVSPALGERRPGFLASAALTYASNVGVAVLSLGNVLLVARALGPEGRGHVALATTIAILSSNLSALGVQEANANIGGVEPHLRAALATNSLLLAAITGAAAAGVVAALVVLFPGVGGGSSTAVLAFALASIPAYALGLYLRLLCQSAWRFGVTNATWLLPPVLNLAVNGLLYALGLLTVETAVGAWAAGQALATGVLAWYVGTRLSGFGRPSRALARRAVGFGLRTHAGRSMMLGNYRLDQWLLGGIAGARELGLYSVAVAWAEALFFLPTALVQVQRPDLVRADRRGAARRAAVVFRVALVVTVPLAAAMMIAAPVLCVTVFGDEFRGSIDDLRLLVPGAIGVAALKLLGNALTAQRRPLLETAAIGIALAADIVLAIALIPTWGGAGAAAASSIAYTAGAVAVVALFSATLGAPPTSLVPRGGDVRSIWRRARSSLHRGPAAVADREGSI